MPIVTLPGTSRMYYPFDLRVIRQTQLNGITVDASDECIAIGGRVWFEERIASDGVNPFTKNIARVWFRFGSVVKAGGSGLRVSLRSMDGFPASDQPKPASTEDQTVAIANSDAGFVSGNFYRTNPFSATREVFYNQKLCVVICFDSSGRLGSDSVTVMGRNADLTDSIWTSWLTRQVSGSWVVSDYWPIIVLEFDDETYGTLEGSYITHGMNSETSSSSSTFNEWGLQFTVPYAMSFDQAIAYMGCLSTGADFDLILYQGTSAMMTRRIAATATSVVGLTSVDELDIKEFTFTSEQTLNVGATYVLAIKPAFAHSVTLGYETLAEAGHSALWGGTDLALVKRNGGSWTVDNTKIPLLGLRVSALQDEA